jgi:hypothetical protein
MAIKEDNPEKAGNIWQGRSQNNENCRHKLFRREVWGSLMGSTGQSPRKLTGYTTEMVTCFIILEVLLTT